MDSPYTTATTRNEQLKAAMTHMEAREWRLAEVRCRIILASDPSDVEATLVLGLAIAASGEAARAAPILGRVRRARPELAEPCRDFANMEPRVPRALVKRQYRSCLRLTPAEPRLRQDFALYLLENGEPDGALVVLRDATEAPEVSNLRGMALAELGKFREALRCFEHASRAAGDTPGSWCNLAMMLRIEGRFDESLAAYDRALRCGGGDPMIRVSRAMTLLQMGRWDEGWREYEWRFARPGHAAISTAPSLPTLAGGEPLHGKHVLVWHEEGFGDTLQFARYLPLLAGLGATVTALVPAPLVRLFVGLRGVAVRRQGEGALPEHDWQCPFSSLPRVFGATPRSVPAAPYLAADPELAAAWSARLPRDGIRAGIVWAGLARPWLQGFTSVDRRRSCGLAAFAPLASVRGARFVSLQAGAAAAQGQEPPPGIELVDPMDAVHDFADTAAVIANLDVVISVDTSVAHLAGAMGKPVFLLDRFDNCWRWMHGRTDTPWYPSMTIFRQPRPGDWGAVMHRVAPALGSLSMSRDGHGMARALATAA